MRTRIAPWDYNRRPLTMTPKDQAWHNAHQAWFDWLWKAFQYGRLTRQEWNRMIDQGTGLEQFT